MRSSEIAGKTHIGYIVDVIDPAGMNRKAVHIPSLMKSTIPGENYIFCKEAINTFVRTRDPLKPNIPYMSYGSLQPILPGTKVLVTFINNSLESGYIIGIDATVKETLSPNEWLIFKTQKDTELYVNDKNKVCHLKNAGGKSNIFMTEDSVYLQVNEVDPEGKGEDELIAQSYIQLGKNAIIFKVGDTSYRFGNNGININNGKDSSTFIETSKDTININASKSINISSDSGNVHINGQYTYVTGYNELHLFGSDTRLTGSQKAQISGTTVALWGWMDAHIKGMHVGIDAWLSFDTFTTVKNEMNLALKNSFSSILSDSSVISSASTGLKAESYSIKAQDGIVLSNLGIGAGISASVGVSMTAVTSALKISLATLNTGFLMNDPFTSAANQVLTMTIAGSASQAIGSVNTVGQSLSKLDDYNNIITSIKMRRDHELNSKKYILPEELSI